MVLKGTATAGNAGAVPVVYVEPPGFVKPAQKWREREKRKREREKEGSERTERKKWEEHCSAVG